MRYVSLFTTMSLFLIIFILVAFLTETNAFPYDNIVIQWVEQASSSFLLEIMEIISIIGSSEAVLLLTFLITVIFIFKRDWFHTKFFLFVSIGGVVLNFVLKFLFHRDRPGEASVIEVFNFSFDIPSHSFPSGHMMRITILVLFLVYMNYRFLKNVVLKTFISFVFIVILVNVALSRLFLDAHFLSDVLAAVSISIVWFCLCYFIFKKGEGKQNDNQYAQWRQF